jgi:Zn-dependent protease with chaperone function
MAPYQTTAYRYPHEQVILFFTVALVFAVIALTATATLCLSGLFVLVIVVISYYSSQANHRQLLQHAYAVTPASAPAVAALSNQCQFRLRPGPLEVFIVPSPVRNAYTFGVSGPKAVVVYSALTNEMDESEMRFILGHEMGHVSLGHTRINSLIGGMAGIPAPLGAALLLNAAFLWWNRACEYSADRAGLLACGSVNKAISALIKLGAGPGARSQADLDQALMLLDKQDDSISGLLEETLSTHPLIIKRIQNMRRYASTRAYQQIQAWMASA